MESITNRHTILITGAEGNVGSCVVKELQALGVPYMVGSYNPRANQDVEVRKLDFTDQTTFAAALNGIKQIFLMRPPALANVKKYFHPFIDECKAVGVEQIVFLSLQGAENNSFTPHHKIEKYIQEVGLPYTFVRPSFFMQNLTTTHLKEIHAGEIYVPAGQGKTNFVDVRDIGTVIAKVLAEKDEHLNKAYEITGSESFSYSEIAEILSQKLGTTITYKSPNPLAFLYRKVRSGVKFDFAFIMLALYTVARLGKADHASNDFEKLTKHKPISFEQCVDDNLQVLRGA